jgi:polyisoprenoid-binding protein YceI
MMTKDHMIHSRTLFALATAALLAVGGCAKKEEKPADPATAEPAQVEEPAQAEAPPEEPTAVAQDEDYIKIYGGHEPTTDADPVEIVVQKYTVKSAKFDPKNLEGGTAELELDLSSIKSDKEKRDGHLQSPDYLDVAKFGVAAVKIAEVKKTGDNEYTGQAEVSAHGMTKAFPVKFTVVESSDDSVRIQGEHTFSRLDFGVGKEPDGENEKVAKEVTIKMQLTLQNT